MKKLLSGLIVVLMVSLLGHSFTPKQHPTKKSFMTKQLI